MKHKKLFLILCMMIITLLPLLNASAGEAGQPSGSRTILPDSTMGTLEDDDGADAFRNTLDHTDSRYYVFNDYYNMESAGSLHILPHFATYQQTTEYSCGCAAALMVLHRYGVYDYNEMELCERIGTDESVGTAPEDLLSFLESVGFRTESHIDTEPKFGSIEECEDWLIRMIDNGIPVLVDWEDWGGHWQVIIGIDTCDSESPYDDVLIIADPYDATDHSQDGYYIFSFGRFFDMWYEGPHVRKESPRQQVFIAVFPRE